MKQDLIFLQKKGTFIEVKHFVKKFLLISLWLVKEILGCFLCRDQQDWKSGGGRGGGYQQGGGRGGYQQYNQNNQGYQQQQQRGFNRGGNQGNSYNTRGNSGYNNHGGGYNRGVSSEEGLFLGQILVIVSDAWTIHLWYNVQGNH